MNQQDDAYALLDHLAVLQLSGVDAKTYLQGQFTQDVRLINEKQAIYGAVLTPQGKTISDAWVLQQEPNTLLMIHSCEQTEALLKRLNMFSLGHQVAINRTDMNICAYYGPSAHHVFDHQPQAELESYHKDECVYLAHAGFIADCCWRIGNSCAPPLGKLLQQAEVERVRICAGVPRFGVDWVAGDYPLHANLREMNGISFDKGCYVGQEICSRMHWRGAVRHALYHLLLDSLPTKIPDEIFTTVCIGKLSSAAKSFDDPSYGIARLPFDVLDDDNKSKVALHLQQQGITIQVLSRCSSLPHL